jgi:hypothetical protein
MVQNWKDFASSDKTTLSHGDCVDGEAFLGILVYQRRPRRTSVTSPIHHQTGHKKTTNNQTKFYELKNT